MLKAKIIWWRLGQNEPEREIFYLVERQVDVTVHYKARKLTFLLTKSPRESYSVFIREPYNVRKKFLRITRGGGGSLGSRSQGS